MYVLHWCMRAFMLRIGLRTYVMWPFRGSQQMFNESQANNISLSTNINSINNSSSNITMVNGNGANNNNAAAAAGTTTSSGNSSNTGTNGRGSPLGNVVAGAAATTPINNTALRSNNDEHTPNANNSSSNNNNHSRSEYNLFLIISMNCAQLVIYQRNRFRINTVSFVRLRSLYLYQIVIYMLYGNIFQSIKQILCL